MITTHDGHSYDKSLLTPGSWALDVGARGFGFANRMAELGLNVIAMEPDRTVSCDRWLPEPSLFLNAALVGNPSISEAMYADWSNGEGNQLAVSRPIHAKNYYPVPCITLAKLMDRYHIPQFDIVKLDCEGSEYDILWNWPRHAAVQISVEFHDFLGKRPRPTYYDELFAGPLADYNIVQHEWTPLNAENPIRNYWDSLFCLKAEFILR